MCCSFIKSNLGKEAGKGYGAIKYNVCNCMYVM